MADFRRYGRETEVIECKFKILQVNKTEKAATGVDGAIKTGVAEVEAAHMASQARQELTADARQIVMPDVLGVV
ncbi:hypothetical protein CRG98_042391 [Punica granatum]|uniref:Uncharacterized protein n=1 Tax=Punica granatum TaxID=22663 RepID=A0A2I0I0B9_PUNGR|nr:hypothetical protein CRG98_042391 [Punica granatum]